MRLPEVEVVKRIMAGEKQLYGQIIDKYQRSIYNLAYRMLGNREDALDLAQETFLRAFKKLELYDQSRPFSPWIHRIASNLCLNQFRKKKLHTVPLVMDDGEGGEFNRQIEDKGKEPGEQIVIKENKQELIKAIGQLPEKYRVPLILRHFHHYTYEEIGEVMEVPPGTVKTWIYRGRNHLKDFYKKNLDYKEGKGK